eukprot:698506-Alexandrium_andersonii.AAC.1
MFGDEVPTHCCRTDRSGRKCGKPLDPNGVHLLTCKSGGAVVQMHNHLRDSVKAWLQDQIESE